MACMILVSLYFPKRTHYKILVLPKTFFMRWHTL